MAATLQRDCGAKDGSRSSRGNPEKHDSRVIQSDASHAGGGKGQSAVKAEPAGVWVCGGDVGVGQG